MADLNTTKPAENIAQTLKRELPEPVIVDATESAARIGVPSGWAIQVIDREKELARPLRARGVAVANTAQSFVQAVLAAQSLTTCVWCDFDASEDRLIFTAVLNDTIGLPGWGDWRITFAPTHAQEWLDWTKDDGQHMQQLRFALMLEERQGDIMHADGFPTGLQMLTMATEFEAAADKAIKSRVRLQSGGVELVFVDTDSAATQQKMRVFEKFKIAVPVFIDGPETPEGAKTAVYPCDARLRYTLRNPTEFWYELIRPDRVYLTAARKVVEEVRAGLGADIPMRMGSPIART